MKRILRARPFAQEERTITQMRLINHFLCKEWNIYKQAFESRKQLKQARLYVKIGLFNFLITIDMIDVPWMCSKSWYTTPNQIKLIDLQCLLFISNMESTGLLIIAWNHSFESPLSLLSLEFLMFFNYVISIHSVDFK